MRAREPIDAGPSARHFDLTADSAWEDVQAQYRRLVQQWHPDRHPLASRAEAQAEFIEIVAAFKTLRLHYGEQGRLPPVATPPSGRSATEAGSAPPGTEGSRRPPSPGAMRARAMLRSPLTALVAALCLALGLAALVLVLDGKLERERRDQALSRSAGSGERTLLRHPED